MESRFPEGAWAPLEAHASTRTYYTGLWRGRPAVLADFGEDRDGRERFAAAAVLLRGQGLPVPELLEVPPGESWLVQGFVEGVPASKVRWSRDLEGEALALAAAFGALDLSGWPPELPLHRLDGDRLRFELAFFDLHFLQGLLNLPAEGERAAALGALADAVAAYPTAPAHRDFHSENLIWRPRSPLVVVDFQDLLLAPRCYDAASLAVDAYRHVPSGFYTRCARVCQERFGCEAEEFERTALQRALKALGTFGYQITRRKRARYLSAARSSAPRAASLLREGPAALRGLAEDLEAAAAWM